MYKDAEKKKKKKSSSQYYNYLQYLVHRNFSLLYIPKVELYSQNKIYRKQLVSQNPLISYSLIRGKGGQNIT